MFLFIGTSVPAFATDSTLTLSTTGTSVSVSPSASGTFAESATPATISVTTDNYTGYALTLKSSSASASPLTNTTDSSVTIPSISSAISQSDFQSSSSYVNQWGIKPSKLSGSNNFNYLSAPTTTGITLEQTSAANSTANTYNLYIATKLDYETPSGSYSTTLIAAAVANLATYSITYADSSSSASDMPSAQSGAISGSSVTLSANSPVRDSTYVFQGWCNGTISNQDTTSPSCSGITYDPGDSFPIDQTASNVATLNAIWRLNNLTAAFSTDGTGYGTVSGSSITTTAGSTITVSGNTVTINGNTITATPAAETAQYTYAFSSWTNNCGSTLSTNNCTIQANFTRTTRSYTVTIARNNTSYGSVSTSSFSQTYGSSITASGSTSTSISVGGTTVTATANSGYVFKNWSHSCGTTLTSACTITANFEQPPTMQTFSCSSLASGATTTLVDSRDNEQYLVGKLADGKCWMLDNLRLGSTSAISLTSANTNISSNYTLPASGTANFTFSSGYTAAINVASKNTTTTSYGNGSGKIGVYYNYCAASAGTICSPFNSSNASYDICPKGWRLPTGSSSGEFQALYTAYSSDATNFRSALSTPLSGYFHSGSAYSQGSNGNFWSSTQGDDSSMYSLTVDSSDVYPGYFSDFEFGYSIRCVSQ